VQTLRNPARIVVADDSPASLDILKTRLASQGYDVVTATDGQEALDAVLSHRPDLILLDVMMPRLDGFEVCRRLRADLTLPFIPIILVTAKDDTRDIVAGLDSGADEYLTKPVDHAALTARVRSILRTKALHDMVEEQKTQLAEWNRALERRVAEQLEEIQRISRLKRFLSPQVAELVLSSGGERLLESHRRDVVVVFGDLRGFTAFAEAADPDTVIPVLREYHAALGSLIHRHQGTLERFAGDAVMVFFNDPVPIDKPAEHAVRTAIAMHEAFVPIGKHWEKRGYDLALGVGIAQGYATLGAIGFEGRWDYAAIGNVTNLAARLCGEAKAGQVLLDRKTMAALDGAFEFDPVGPLTLKGFSQPVPAFSLKR
jgi:adenylate cyclase